MIQILHSNKNVLAWQDQEKNRHKIEIGKGTYIYNESHIMFMDSHKSIICVYNEEGRLVKRLRVREDVFFLRLYKHPKLGLCAITFIKIDNKWKDEYLVFRDNTLIRVSIKKKQIVDKVQDGEETANSSQELKTGGSKSTGK